MTNEPYYSKSVSQALEAQQADQKGLSDQQARSRLEQYGPNKLSEGKKKSVLQIFLEQFKDLLVVILIVAALISAASENVESTIVIFAVLILNAILGTVQYLKAEKSLESLKAMSSPTAKVLRGGVRVEIPSADVVPAIRISILHGRQHPGGRQVLYRPFYPGLQPACEGGHRPRVSGPQGGAAQRKMEH